ncbi:glutamine synthetase [Candidatus Pelagibacter sp.]|nr:glutamine synthetase [Candidatus Pelagibacter sp.]
MSKNEKIYYENFKDAVDRNRKKIPSVHKKLKNAGVKYILSSWIDLHGIPKSKPVPMSDFEPLCLGKGPQFAVGGLMKHAEAITSITCSTVNSYNGLVPRVGGFEGGTVTWAPTNITYGHNNRSAQFRLPQNRYCIENRAADMTMNVYLAFSMTLSAAVEGIKKKIHPGKSTDQDLYNMTESEFKKLGIKRLPRNLLMALEALKNDKLSDEVIGSVMKKSLLAYKNDEWERYHQAVTDWEVKEYLRLY